MGMPPLTDPVDAATGSSPQTSATRSYGQFVDTKQEIQEFLTSRRGRITPEQAGVRTFGSGPRRVPGLRREVASLAGVSIAYYTKLERGDASGVSDTVLEALSRALQLDGAERAHLFDLVRAQQPVARTRRRRGATQTIRPGVQRLLDRIDAPACVRNGRMDILATNNLGEALYSEMLANPTALRTRPGSASSTRARRRSSSTGMRPPTRPSPFCVPKPGATPTTTI